METTRLSSKGQIIIPQAIREAHKWQSGLVFNVIETEQGLLLMPRLPFKVTQVKDLIGCVEYKGSKKSLKDMEQGIATGAKKRK